MSIEAKRTHLFARQPLSALGKLTLWGLLGGGLTTGIIALALAIFVSLRQDVLGLIMTVCLLVGAGLVAGMVIGAILIGTISLSPVAAGTTYTNGVPTVHMSAGNFDQPSVTIAKGSKLLLMDDTSSLHILANGSWENGAAKPEHEPGAPAVNNVQVNGNSVEIGPFTIAGTYHIFCTVHQGMNLTIIVQ
jgi:plastocyanin